MKDKLYFVKLIASIIALYVGLNVAFLPTVNGKLELDLAVSLMLIIPAIILGFVGLAIASNPKKSTKPITEE